MEACSCAEIRKMIEEICLGRGTAKRSPNAYNLFMSRCIREIETKGPIQERFRRCAERYKRGER